MKASRATHRADFVRPSASFTLRRLPKALVLGIVAFVVLVMGSAGLTAPAKAAAAWSPPVAITTVATTSGNGVLRITPVVVSDTAYTLTPFITGGATFAGGASSIAVEIVGEGTVKVPYTCTAPGGLITLSFGFKGSPILGADALCGALAPVSVWAQQANIVPSAPGSGSASVALINTGSNAVGVFVAYVGGQEWSRFTVAAGATSTQSLTGLPLGSTLEIYGIQDGTASAVTPLASAVIPNVVSDPGVPISYLGGNWNEAGTGTLYPVAKFTTPDSVYLLVYQDGVRISFAGPITVDGTHPVATDVFAPDCGDYDVYFSTAADLSGAIRWSKHVEQAACQPAVVTPPTTPTTPVTPVEPATPVVPAILSTPVAPTTEQATQTERPNLTFETSAAEPQYNLWGAFALFVTSAAIVAVLVYRRRNVA